MIKSLNVISKINSPRNNHCRDKRTLCYCSDMRKKHEVTVSNRIKENVNQLLIIGSVDFKLMYEIAKDIDAFHKDKFEDIKRKYQSSTNSIMNGNHDQFLRNDEVDDTLNILREDDNN